MTIRYLFFLALLISCSAPKSDPTYTVFTNATLIDGSGSPPIANSVLIIQGDSIISVGSNDSPIPANAKVIDLSGKFIIPGLINSHGHVGTDDALENLKRYARYGITSVVSLGGEKRLPGPDTTLHARLYIAGEVITSLETVDKNNALGVDWMKIRVDDNLGASQKMSEDEYTAIIKRSHELNYKIATHMYYLDDAKKLLAAGSDLMAHSVRDLPVDKEFISLIKAKKVCYCPTLTRELSTFVYGSTPDFFSDPFFTREYPDSIVAPLKDPVNQEKIRNSKSAQTYQKQLPVAMANLKTLSDEGVSIAMGTDSGIPTRFIGYFEHIEMAMMAEAGLSPMQIIRSATADAAKCMGLKNIGLLKEGYKADFVVLDENPLLDIKNTRKIDQVYISGKKLDR